MFCRSIGKNLTAFGIKRDQAVVSGRIQHGATALRRAVASASFWLRQAVSAF
jgi:hypothetical protein